jgi:hypothetical protein
LIRNIGDIASVLEDAKKVAKRYRELTGKPLGITGEVAEFTAATLLNLELAEARQSGYDAVKKQPARNSKCRLKEGVVFPVRQIQGRELEGSN